MTDREEIVQALANGQAIVHYAKCWSCMLGQCPGGPHDWADGADIAHAAATAQPDPSGQSCGCACVDGPSLGPDEDPPDLDEVRLDAEPCPICGSTVACGTDSEGRPLIHAIPPEEDLS